jgi:hypothetical protein
VKTLHVLEVSGLYITLIHHPDQAPATKKSRTAKPTAAAAAAAPTAASAVSKKAPSAAVKKQAKAIAEKTFAALAVFAQASQLEKSAKDKLTETVSEHMVGNMHAVAAKSVEKKELAAKAKKAKTTKKAPVKKITTKAKAAPKTKVAATAAPKKQSIVKKTIAKK